MVFASRHYNNQSWSVDLEKDTTGTKLKMDTRNDDLQTAIDQAYEKWILATTYLPSHSLRQIEHQMEAPPKASPNLNQMTDDEIPF